MRYVSLLIFLPFLLAVLTSCRQKHEAAPGANAYVPDSPALLETIRIQDSLFFGAYNRCDLELQAAYYSDSIEFYHDKGGLETSKQAILDGTRKFICGKVTRTLVPGSIEVYPIAGWGAIEMGMHVFHNSEEPNAASRPGKFVIFWQHRPDDKWSIKRVVSLH